ncbi:hypothetical protein BpHYR1_022115 [Brachionus plicatilis]|uniref:Uncharacterized protein n=1 Tax=Brachionus plicatilis TaxID=10195 RepID=A0A3M7PZ48_BRAPC|nr:hypothetical protein BpHYR1_022115 [Brachionus plicatilis]
MKKQILLLFLIVTSCYCEDETTYSELSTESGSLTNNSDSDSTNQTKSMVTTTTELFDELDKLNLDWKSNCSSARIYYKLLEEEFEKNRDDKVVKEERLKKLIPCKRDCNFDRLLNANYSEDRKNFSKTFLPFVSSDVAKFCQNTLGTYLAPVRNDSLPLKLSDIAAITLYTTKI